VADIFKEVDEEVRKDKATELWRRYGGFVIGACIALVLATALKVGWREYQANLRIEESERFAAAVALLADDKQKQAAITSLAALADEADTGYAILARLREAQARALAGDKQGAVAAYDRISEEVDEDSAVAGLAQLLAAMQLINDGPRADLEARLDKLDAGNSPWRFSALELKAVLALRMGDKTAARKQFKELSQLAGAPAGLKQRAARMLFILGPDS